MHCPSCGIILHLDKQSKEIDNFLNHNINTELFICKGCKLVRPDAWWDSLELDINTEIKFDTEAPKEEVPEELAGQIEMPWGD